MHKKSSNQFSSEFLETLSHETPFFLFSKEKISHNLNEFKKNFPGALIQYAMKANAEREAMQTILDEGAGFEVASKYELAMLKEIGVPAEKIIYGTSVKPISHIKEFFDYGVDRFAFDSIAELEKIASVAPKSKVYVRVAVVDKGSVFKFSEKFGTSITNIVPFLEHAKKLGLQPYGISFNIGSQASDVMPWANAITSLKEPIEQLSKLGIILDILNLGGGFPCNTYASAENYLPLDEIYQNIIVEYQKLPYQPKLMLEPGRAVIADTAVLVASVIAKIERQEHTWVFLDAGVYNGLFESMAYQGSTRYRITALSQRPGVGETMFALAGPTGDSPDIITREALLPRDIDVGDKLVIHDIGAYSLPATCPFNGFPKPLVYFI